MALWHSEIEDNEANSLFLDSIWLSHLGTDAAIQGVAYEPSPFTVVNFEVPCPVFLRDPIREFRLAVDIQVGCHPVAPLQRE